MEEKKDKYSGFKTILCKTDNKELSSFFSAGKGYNTLHEENAFGEERDVLVVPYSLFNKCLLHTEQETKGYYPEPQSVDFELRYGGHTIENTYLIGSNHDGVSFSINSDYLPYETDEYHEIDFFYHGNYHGISGRVREQARETYAYMCFLEDYEKGLYSEEKESLEEDIEEWDNFADYLDTLEMTGEEQKEYERFKLFCKMQPLKQKAQAKLKQMGGE